MTGSTLVGTGLLALSLVTLAVGLAVRDVRRRWACALGAISVFRGPCRVVDGADCDWCNGPMGGDR